MDKWKPWERIRRNSINKCALLSAGRISQEWVTVQSLATGPPCAEIERRTPIEHLAQHSRAA